MTVEEFISGYNKASDKEKYVKKNMKDEYIPYEKKIAVCMNIVEATMYTNIGGKRVFCQNTPVQYMLFVLNLIDLYTSIEIDFSDANSAFNSLEYFDLTGLLLSNISKNEYSRFDTLLHMVIDDELENNRSICSSVDTIKLLFGDLLE